VTQYLASEIDFQKREEYDVNDKERHRKIKKSSKKAIGKNRRRFKQIKKITQLRETLLRRQIQDWVILPGFSGILFVDFGAVRFQLLRGVNCMTILH